MLTIRLFFRIEYTSILYKVAKLMILQTEDKSFHIPFSRRKCNSPKVFSREARILTKTEIEYLRLTEQTLHSGSTSKIQREWVKH